MIINYNGRKFIGVTNSPNGQVGNETVFHYHQHGNILTATYAGGLIQSGYFLGIVHGDNSLEFVYHHLDSEGKLKNGFCKSHPELLADGRILLREKWEWTFGGDGKGESIVEEI